MKKILLIEDEKSITKNLCDLLKSKYIVLPVVRTAEEAIEVGMTTKPDLIVSKRRLSDNKRALNIVFRLQTVP